jgi:hypothetical protein
LIQLTFSFHSMIYLVSDESDFFYGGLHALFSIGPVFETTITLPLFIVFI